MADLKTKIIDGVEHFLDHNGNWANAQTNPVVEAVDSLPFHDGVDEHLKALLHGEVKVADEVETAAPKVEAGVVDAAETVEELGGAQATEQPSEADVAAAADAAA